jgi:hypothetical protein
MSNPEPEKHLPISPEKPQSIIQPIIDELKAPPAANPANQAPPRGPLHPPQPAELDQDPGGGYNPDHTIPQP